MGCSTRSGCFRSMDKRGRPPAPTALCYQVTCPKAAVHQCRLSSATWVFLLSNTRANTFATLLFYRGSRKANSDYTQRERICDRCAPINFYHRSAPRRRMARIAAAGSTVGAGWRFAVFKKGKGDETICKWISAAVALSTAVSVALYGP